MRLLAKNEIYRLDIRVGVTGDGETKSKLTATEKMADQTKKKMQALDKINISPTAKLNDKASSAIDKINSKHRDLNRAVANPSARLNDQASSKLNNINSTIKRLENTNATATIKLKEQSASFLDKIQSKNDNFKSTNVNPTARAAENSRQTDNTAKQFQNVSKSLDITNSKIELQKNKLENLKTAYQNATNVTQKNKIQEQILNSESSILKLESTIDKLNSKKIKLNAANGLDGEFRSASVSITKELDKVENKAKETSKALKDINVGESISKSGSAISNVGDKLSTRITLPIIGLGIAAGKIGMDFDSAMSRVKAISGATGDEFTKLHDQALQLGADTAFSSKQAAEGMENLASAGFTTTEIMAAMPGMLDLAASSGEGLASSADIAASTLRGFGLATDKAGHVADVLAKNASATNAAVSDTGEALKYISPVAQTAGWSLESVAASIGELANSGIKGSQAGTILRATFSRLAKPSDASATAMENMGFKAYDAQHKMKSLSTIVSDLQKSTANMTDEQKQNTIAQIFGEEAMSGVLTLIKNGPQALDELIQSYISSDGAAKEMAKTMQDNAKSSIEQMMGSIETAAIKIEGAFAPSITKLANYVQDLANKFSALSPEQQMFYEKLALGAAALGPTIKLIGGLTNGIGGIIKIGGKLASIFSEGAIAATEMATGVAAGAGATEAAGVAATAGLGKLSTGVKSSSLIARLLPLAFSPAGLAIEAVGVTAGLVAYQLSQDVVPKVDLFADGVQISSKRVTNSLGNTVDAFNTTTVKISDATKKSVGAYMEMDSKVQKSLLNMKYTNATVTNGIANDLTTTFSKMGETITTELDKDLAYNSNKIQDMLSKSSISGGDQSDILAQLQQHYDNQKNITKSAMDEINSIIAGAKDRSFTTEELNRMNELNSQMTKNAVTALSENEKESAVILGRIKDQSTRITAETASDIVKQLEDQRVKTIDAANVEYEERVRIAEAIRSEGGAKATETADAIITEAQRQRDETINAANDTKTQGIDVLKQSYSELGTTVDANSGVILNWWGRLKAWWDNNTFGSKTAQISVSGADTTTWGGNSDYYQNKDKTTAGYETTVNSWNGYATGTSNATRGYHDTAENGFEILIGRKKRWFEGGEKVLNNKQSKTFLENQQTSEPFQVKQGQYQLAQPQVQVAGAGGIGIGDIKVIVNGNQDTDGIINEVVQVVGYKLKEAFANIK